LTEVGKKPIGNVQARVMIFSTGYVAMIRAKSEERGYLAAVDFWRKDVYVFYTLFHSNTTYK